MCQHHLYERKLVPLHTKEKIITILRNLYSAQIYPHILYGNEIWRSTFVYLHNKIVLQKIAYR